MNAPYGWPTKFPLPQFRITRVIVAGLAFLAIACSENLTQPGSSSSVAPPSSVPLAPDVIVVERTTTDAAGNGEIAAVHKSRKILTPSLRRSGGADIALSGTVSQPVALVGLPLPPVSLPARTESAMCSTLPAWTDRTKGINGRDVLLTGIGDAPASNISVTQADGTVLTIERTWTRTANSWQLDKQVVTGPRGYRDVVTYRHETPAGILASNALPATHCATPASLTGMPSSAVSASFYLPHPGALSAALFPPFGATALKCGSGGGDDCYEKQLSVYKDDIAVAVTATGVVLACTTPAVLTTVPCLLATTAYLAAVASLKIDQMSLQHCLEQLPKPATPASLYTPGATSLGDASVLGSAPASLASYATAGARALSDCGGGGAPSSLCHWERWEISYDGGHTWEYFDTIMVCDAAM